MVLCYTKETDRLFGKVQFVKVTAGGKVSYAVNNLSIFILSSCECGELRGYINCWAFLG